MRTRRRRWGGSARARHRAAGHSCASLTRSPREGKEAARAQRGAARLVPDEQRRERQLFTRLYGGWAHGVETLTRADRLGPVWQQKAADVSTCFPCIRRG
eukprot:scaffold104934_cov69-Phaeocystis_antarctica.AAC.2